MSTLDEADVSDVSSTDDFLRAVAHVPNATPRPAARFRSGQKLGRYELKRMIGRGGMGVVYEAFDPTLHRDVALKLLRLETDERRKRFLREARSAAAISHPNIASIYDIAEADGEVFIAMELVAGRSLRSVAREQGGKLPEAEAIRVAHEIARGVAAAHDAGVLHRDIKPENVMIRSDGAVKVLDFGLAKLESSALGSRVPSDVVTQEGARLGSPGYMSPEQARGLAVDARSDVWSIGVVLYELLAGRRPFVGPTDSDVLAAILRDDPARIEGASIALESLVMKCLRKKPDERFAHAEEIACELERAVQSPAPRGGNRRLARVATFFGVLMALASSGGPSPAATGPVAITDLPRPRSRSAEALAAYDEAIRAFRSARWGLAKNELRKAVKLDPNIAIAQLRLAMTYSEWTVPVAEAQLHFREAARLRDDLTPRDAALLDAMQPVLDEDPLNEAETGEHLEALAKRYPDDAEMWLWLAWARRHEPKRSVEAAERAVAIDPLYADAWQVIAQGESETSPDRAIAALKRCVEVSPATTDCIGERAKLESRRGKCEEAAAVLQPLARDPDVGDWILSLDAHMLYATEADPKAVAGALDARWTLGDSMEEKELGLAMLAAAYGHFDEAAERAREGLIKRRPKLRSHVRFAVLLADTELEMGELEKAGATAMAFLGQRSEWKSDRPRDDSSVYLARIAARAGLISAEDLRQRRDAWLHESPPDNTVAAAEIWSLAYARGAQTRVEAEEALAARRPSFEHDILNQEPLDDYPYDVALGETEWLAGEKVAALGRLERAATQCDRFDSIFATTRATLLYGKALEEIGDVARACEVFSGIVDRWGNATPRSVTAEEAKARSAALSCAIKGRRAAGVQ